MDEITKILVDLMPQMQKDLFDRALKFREDNTKVVDNYEAFKKAIDEGNFVKAFWAGSGNDEEAIQKETKATVRCIPFEQNEGGGTCFYTGKPAEKIAIFGKSY
jgi:prolyl-tRNA synthetase